MGLNGDVRDWKDPGKLLGASKESVEYGIFGLLIGDEYGVPRGTSLVTIFENRGFMEGDGV